MICGTFPGPNRNHILGIDQLDPLLWGVYPNFRYRGIDANLTNWPAWKYGPTLTYYGTSSPPNLLVSSSPYSGPSDKSVEMFGNTGAVGPGSYQDATGTTTGDVTTGDIFIEMIIKFVAGGGGWIISKGAFPSGGNGWRLYYDSVPNWVIPNNALVGSYGAASGFDHLVFSYNRDITGVQGIRHYRNGTLKNLGAQQITTTLTNAYPLTINGDKNRALTNTHFYISYVSMWTSQDWIPADTTAVDAMVLARYNALQGNY